MATVGNDRMIVRADCRDDRSWLFLVCYTACFGESELGLRFDDSLLVRPIHDVDQCGFGYESPVTFTACSHRVFRRKRIVVRAGCYDPEAGLDTVSAWIRLQRNGSHGVDDEAATPVWVTQRDRRSPVRSHRRLVPAGLVRC